MNKRLSKIAGTLLFLMTTLVLTGCRTTMPETRTGGKGDFAYIQISSAGKNVKKDVMVSLDNNASFVAKTVKRDKANANGKQYQIKPGKRHIKVSRDGQTLYDGTIFISQQETKIIQIP